MRDRKLKPIHTYKCVFVHIPKCGGTSIEGALKINASHEPIKNYQGPDDYFKFTFVRNPWDRIYSCFEQKVRSKGGNCSDYLNHFPRNMSFREWVKTITLPRNILKDRHFAPMHTLMINKSFDSMDFIGHIENFNNDIRFVCDKIGISHLRVPHKNKTKHKHYTEYYDDETRQIVAEKYAKDIEAFGYEFGE